MDTVQRVLLRALPVVPYQLSNLCRVCTGSLDTDQDVFMSSHVRWCRTAMRTANCMRMRGEPIRDRESDQSVSQ